MKDYEFKNITVEAMKNSGIQFPELEFMTGNPSGLIAPPMPVNTILYDGIKYQFRIWSYNYEKEILWIKGAEILEDE